MFFIGIAGVSNKIKHIGNQYQECPSCGAKTAMHIAMSYSYFHIFFIPIFKYNKKYIATCPNCCLITTTGSQIF